MASIEIGVSSCLQTIDTQGSQKNFTFQKFEEGADTKRDTNNCPVGMLDILRREESYRFIFGQFNFQNDEINVAI